MVRLLIALLLMVPLATVSWSQAPETGSEETAVAESEETEVVESEQTEVSEDDQELDELGYEREDDDDFVPSQDVTADQALPFPVDI